MVNRTVRGGAGDLAARLAYRPPLAIDTLLSFLGARAIPGVEHVDRTTYLRSIRTNDGHTAVIAATPHPTDHHIRLDVSSDRESGMEDLVEAARRIFDLDADPTAIDAALGTDPALRPLVRKTPGIRLPGSADGFELAVRAVIGQQVSVKGARTIAGRLAARFGTPLERPIGPLTHLFPSPEQLAELLTADLGMPASRAGTIRRIARLVAAGELDLTGGADLHQALRMLRDVPGVGPWTSAYVAMRALRDPDAFPWSDLGVRHGFEALGLPSEPAAIRERAERWRPWRAYAVMHLWNASS